MYPWPKADVLIKKGGDITIVIEGKIDGGNYTVETETVYCGDVRIANDSDCISQKDIKVPNTEDGSAAVALPRHIPSSLYWLKVTQEFVKNSQTRFSGEFFTSKFLVRL